MEKAIVIGANGYIGKKLVKELLGHGICVLAISRQTDGNFLECFSETESLTHISLDSKDICMLPQKIANKWEVGLECVFYNFSWSGRKRLMDGSIEEQLANVVYLSNSIKVASEIGCKKFIDSGSIEETFAEQYLNESWGKKGFLTNNGNYAVSKIASRDMCSLLGYLHKISYVHTRFSAVLDSDLKNDGYIASAHKSIFFENGKYDAPQNPNLFDIIDIDDLVSAYYLLGIHGKNKVDYFIGSGNALSLQDYFELSIQWKMGNHIKLNGRNRNAFFNNEALSRDTGIDLRDSYYRLLNKIIS